MSRIGRKPIPIPEGVTIDRSKGEVRVKGPKASLAARIPERISIEIADGEARLARPDDSTDSRAFHGLARALVANMVTGVTKGFSKELEIEGVGYRAESRGQKLIVNVGFSHPIEMQVPEGLSVKVEANTKVSITGADKQSVGQFAADIRALRPPEPYKGKGIRYAGEYIRRKVGKTGAA